MEAGQRRILLKILGVTEESKVVALLLGLILIALTVVACCYCKVYDPSKQWCIVMYYWLKGEPKEAEPPPPERPPAPEREHWYLNRTLKIDRKDRDELGPVADIKGLQGGWYGARNGGFNV